MYGMNIWRSSLRLATATTISVALTACGSDSSNELRGYQAPSAKSSAGVSITDAVTGKPFELRADDGEVLVVYFGYTHCPDICPTTLVAVKNAKEKLGALGSRVDLAMITVDPERDTADVLPLYLSSFTNKFHALVPASTEELKAAEKVFDATSSVTKVDGKVEVIHGGNCYIVDSKGAVVDEWPFGMDAQSMAHDLRILLNERETTT
jgi:protein SCO1/2